MENLPTIWIVAILAVMGIQYLKKASWFPGVAEGKSRINRVFAVIVAAVAATGIAYSSAWDPATGTLVLTFTGLTKATVFKGTWAFLQQIGWQQFIWKLLKEKLT